MRLDLYLIKHFNIQSRNKAHEIIKAHKVKINNKVVLKPSFKVCENCNIELLEENFYVSRAAYKLKYFLSEVPIDLKNLIALDIGSSTGGFTQILLENNVKQVNCVDIGTKQLHKKIKNDKRIIFFENQDIRTYKSNITFDIVTCDVSFISILKIIEYINKLAKNKIIILFKPQFEVGIDIKRDKKGVIKDKKAILDNKKIFLDKCHILNWKLKYNSTSKLKGKEGNEEEFFYFNK